MNPQEPGGVLPYLPGVTERDEVMGVPLRADRAAELVERIDAVVAAGDWPSALGLLRENLVALVTDRFSWVRALLAQAPAAELDPVLRLVQGFLLGAPADGAPMPTDDDRAAFEAWVTTVFIQVVALRWLGRLDEAEEVARGAVPALSGVELADVTDGLALTRLHIGILRLLRGDLDAAIEDLRAAHLMAFHARSAFVVRNCAGDLALAHALRGELTEAERWLEIFDGTDFDPEGHFERYVRVGALVARALVALHRLRPQEAQETLDRLDASPGEELWVFVAVARALLAHVRGDVVAGLAVLEQAQVAHRASTAAVGIAPRLLTVVRADLLLAAGQGVRARAELAELEDASDVAELHRSRVALVTGDPAAAVPVADAVAWGPAASALNRVGALVVGAVARWRLAGTAGGDAADLRAQAHRALGEAVALAAPTRLLLPFALAQRDELLAIAGDGPSAAAVRRLLDDPALLAVGPLVPPRVEVVELSERERAVLAELRTTHSVEVVAKRLFVSTNTVKTQVRNVYRKLGVHSREQALARAHREGLLPAPEEG